MSDGGEKSFAATASRRKKAQRDGNVARSTELGGVLAFGGALVAACACVPPAAGAFAVALRDATLSLAPSHSMGSLRVAAGLAFGPAAAAAATGVTVAVLQGGGLHLGAITIDPKRLDPVAGIKRMLGADAAIGAARALAAFAAALCALVPVVHDVVAASVGLAAPATMAHVAGIAVLHACAGAVAVGVVFGAADYALARRRWLRGLKMSLDELKRDTKENDGDPQARARRKTLHRDLVRGAIARTSEASFVIVNPTHVAVALRYSPPAVPVPEILVRALDDAALRVRAIATDARIPIVEDAPLARLLYGTSARSRTIAPETYVAVAQIVADLAHAGLLE